MTIAEQIATQPFNHIKGLWEKGLNSDFIADAFKLPLQKVEEIIQKIK